ncbi:MAG: histidine kinase [Gammaproteobacteria bacterium]|nr:histidine kinase [Gammaproteobacteria bacterium]
MAMKLPAAFTFKAVLTLKAALKPEVVFPLMPVLLAWLWASLQPQMKLYQADWSLFWPQAGLLLLQSMPLLLAQALLSWLHNQLKPSRLTNSVVLLFWVAGMLVYPAVVLLADSAQPQGLSHWLLAPGLSLLYWLHFWYQRKLQQGSRSRWQWLFSLDAVLLMLLLAWTISWAVLLVSHPPGFAKQPIPVLFDWQRLLQNPGLFLSYLCQFSVLAATMWGCYWLNRYWLIRCILAQYGLLPFVLVSLTLIVLCYPLLAMLLLQLPMNAVEVPAVPAGGPNPFDWYNFFFMFMQWLLTTPLILAFDRQQHEKNLAQIQHRQIQTELLLLQQQINPHFLFNTLNNLYALCLVRSEQAPTLILRLADLLRYVVYQGSQPLVTLQQEINYLQDYLALQQLRVSNKTELSLSLPEHADQYLLPPLLLIMLVENAYKHGVESTAEPSKVNIQLQLQDNRLMFVCENTVPAQQSAAPTGIGLENLRRRLQLCYGEKYSLSSTATAVGWRAELSINLESAPC